MRMVDLIEYKKNKGIFNEKQIQFIIEGYVNGSIPDYQMSALLMAICFNGLNEEETCFLTKAMIESGETIDLSLIEGKVLDKHSSGGVGDKTTLVLTPLVASLGGKIAKMSGRGLGHTGGTIDKLESIPGYKVNISKDDFIQQVNKINISLIGQSESLVPADKKIYALRDVTATVNSIPLIASSIMSKKIASGADTILLDVKYGNGAFMETIDDARKLAKLMISIGHYFHKDTKAILSSMEQPLGKAIGNSLEVYESIMTLLGKGPKDLEELCLQEGSLMLVQGDLYNSKEKAYKALKQAIKNHKGYEKFKELVKNQGGDVSYIENPERLLQSRVKIQLKSKQSGFIKAIDGKSLGMSVMTLGGGRLKKEDDIDHDAGLVLNKKVGDYINKDELLVRIYANREVDDELIDKIYHAFTYCDEFVSEPELVEEIVEG